MDEPMVTTVHLQVPIKVQDLQRVDELSTAHRARPIRVATLEEVLELLLDVLVEAQPRSRQPFHQRHLYLQPQGSAQCRHKRSWLCHVCCPCPLGPATHSSLHNLCCDNFA